MRLAISNIAWDVVEDELVSALLRRYSVDAIDIAPSKYFQRVHEASIQDVLKVKGWWADRGIEITGMQALLFGTNGLNIFSSSESQEALLAHLSAVCRIGGVLGAPRLVFGSPRSRDRSGLHDDEALEKASAFFYRLGDLAVTEGVIVCLEPNPPCYGSNFMTNSAETARIVEASGHRAIRMQFDTGAITINGEDPVSILDAFGNAVGHIHLSEPNLAPLGDGDTNHREMFLALSRYLPGSLVTIEMIATHNEPHLISIERALKVAERFYRPFERAGSP